MTRRQLKTTINCTVPIEDVEKFDSILDELFGPNKRKRSYQVGKLIRGFNEDHKQAIKKESQ